MRRSRSATERKWRRIISAQEASGELAAAYCREHKIGVASFYAWKRRLRDAAVVRGPAPAVQGFVELKTISQGADAQRAGGVEVVIGRLQVRVRRGFDRDLLAEVVGVLEAMEELQQTGGLA